MPLKRELIYIDGKDETDRVVSYSYRGDKCAIIFKKNNTEYSYSRNRAKIVKTAISDDKAYDIFNYLTKIADIVGLKTEEGGNILAKSYRQISLIPRENEVIILSTVDNEISEFTDNPNRLNVAVSRAIKQLILVVNGNDSNKDSNIADLIRYIEYDNFSIIQSNLCSIFDCLYKGFEEKRAQVISKSGKVSEFDSENLMYAIQEVLSNGSNEKEKLMSKLSELQKTRIGYFLNYFTNKRKMEDSMNLHENKDLFIAIIRDMVQKTSISEVYIEKDYWLTRSLQCLPQNANVEKVVFKGTSLSKAWRLIRPFQRRY